MRKSLILLFLAAFVVFVITAAGATELTFWSMPNAPSDLQREWMEEKAAEFEAETGFKIVFEEIAWGEVMQRITNAITTGEGAQVFQVGTTQNPFFAGTGGLVEMDISEFGGADAFMDANLKSCTLDGKYYGVPWFAETRALFINTEMFEEAGVEPPQTWEELMEVGKKIVEVHGEGTAIATAGTGAWDIIHNWAILLWSHGGEMLTEDNSEVAFNSEAGYKAMDYWVNLVKSGLASKACAEYNQPQADSAFINGNVAMCIMGPWNVANIEDENPDLPYTVVEPPAGPEGRAAFSGGSNLVIRSNITAEEKDAALAWIKFLLRKENVVEYTKDLTHFIPATKDAFTDPYYDKGIWKVFKKTLGYATAYPPIVEWGQLENAVKLSFSNVLTDYINGDYGENSSEEYLDQAAAEVNDILGN